MVQITIKINFHPTYCPSQKSTLVNIEMKASMCESSNKYKVLSPFFKTGVTIASFQADGNDPWLIEVLKMFSSGSVRVGARAASWVASHPALFFFFSFLKMVFNVLQLIVYNSK